MEREKGTLIRWDDEKGYGFIRPHNGKEDIFLHMKSLPPSQRRPKQGDMLSYEVGVDDRQRYYADLAKIKGFAWSRFSICRFCLTLLFCLYIYFVFQQTFPFHPLAIYAAMSLITIWAYGRDKHAAQSGGWRTREFRLHLLEFLGGWPGAFLAQRFYRHKSRKLSYQIVFWLIVAAHGLLWSHVLTHQELYRPYRQAVTEKLDLFIALAQGGIRQLVEQEDSSEVLPGEKRTQGTHSAKTGRRSIVRYDKQARIVEGIVTEVRADEGVIVSLQTESGTEGILDASTLVKDFPGRFTPGERIEVAIGTIRIEGKQKRIELLLVER